MTRLPVHLLLPRGRRLASPGRLTHTHCSCQCVATATEVVVGIVVFFSTFLAPAAYVLGSLREFRRA